MCTKHRLQKHTDGRRTHRRIAGAVAGAAVAYYLIEQSKRKGVAMFSAWKKKRPSVEPVITALASPAGGHYSQAIKNGEMVYLSGLLPITPDGTKLTGAPFKEQAEQVLRSLEAILVAAGSSLQKLIQVRVSLSLAKGGTASLNDNWGAFNGIYAAKQERTSPHDASYLCQICTLVLLEVEAVAAL